MSKFMVEGGGKLAGEIAVQGSKNAAFPVIAASILTDETCEIENVPDISDVRNFLAVLEHLGAEVDFRDHRVRINTSALKPAKLPLILMKKLRGSILFAGPLLARFGSVNMAFPGGDAIGKRAIDVHLEGFRKLGAVVREENEEIEIAAEKMVGNRIVLGVTTVTGTENLILASVLAEDVTEIKLAATEPHVQSLCKCLRQMGATIEGIGTPYLRITGVRKLRGFKFKLNPDEIEAITFCVAAAATQSELTVSNIEPDVLDAPLAVLERMRVRFKIEENRIKILKQKAPYQGTRIITGVYPQLLTDYQPLFGVLATQVEGKTTIHDWIYEGRQEYLRALSKMGARVEFDDVHRARIYGPVELRGAEIKTPDLRAGASILIASLVAHGVSTIYNAEIIDRGYERLDERLAGLGAKIKRVD